MINYYLTRLNTRLELFPPKPRVVFTTALSSFVSASGLSSSRDCPSDKGELRLTLGGMMPVWILFTAKVDSTPPAAQKA
jgi:hypothetical protein